jgi:hypothetical protein
MRPPRKYARKAAGHGILAHKENRDGRRVSLRDLLDSVS